MSGITNSPCYELFDWAILDQPERLQVWYSYLMTLSHTKAVVSVWRKMTKSMSPLVPRDSMLNYVACVGYLDCPVNYPASIGEVIQGCRNPITLNENLVTGHSGHDLKIYHMHTLSTAVQVENQIQYDLQRLITDTAIANC